MNVQKHTALRILYTTLSVLIISFIFENSLMDASVSSIQSTSVMDAILGFFSNIGIQLSITENFIRKCAHFVEFSLLSVSLFLMYLSYFQKLLKTVLLTLSTGFMVACIDEFIQLFSDGRSAQISDVILDFTGVLITAVIIYVVILMYKNRRGRK